jgi:hypothetical protein
MVGQTQQPIAPRPLIDRIRPWVRNLVTYRNLITYLLCVAALTVLTFVEHKPPEPADPAQDARAEFWATDFWYKLAVSTPDPRDSHVVVITVGKDMEKDFPLGSEETNATTAEPDTRESGSLREKGSGRSLTQHQARSHKSAPHAEHAANANHKTSKAETVSLAGACKVRLYIAELLKVLANLRPKVVVLDVWLDPELCSDERVTSLFFDELGKLSERAPVILGLQSRSAADLQANSPADLAYMRNRQPALRNTELVLMPVTHPPQSIGERIIEAVARGDSDTRRIPLGWPVYEDFPQSGANIGPRWKDTLSVAAVRAFDPHQKVLKTIEALTPDGLTKVSTMLHPYTSLLREDQLPIVRAIDLICSNPPNESWRNTCVRTRILPVNSSAVRNPIVVIGIAGLGGDVHQSVIGRVPGVILQANYIQSLLSNRLYQFLPLAADLLLGVVWLLGVLIVAWCFRFRSFRALTLSLLATILSAYFILKGLVWLGYYTELLVPLTIAAIVTNVTIRFHHFLIHQGGV